MRHGTASSRLAPHLGCRQTRSHHRPLCLRPVVGWRAINRTSGAFSSCPTSWAKIKTKVKIRDLPQGKLGGTSASVEELDDDGPSYPTVMQQARNNMRKFDNCVLLTRVGGFYEFYFEHAEEYGPLLNLKVAKKGKNNVPMVSNCQKGFPFPLTQAPF